MGAKGGSLWKQFTFRLSHKRFEYFNLVSIMAISLRFDLMPYIYLHSFLCIYKAIVLLLKVIHRCPSFVSDTASEGGGHLSIEDSQGSITNTFLEGGFLEFLNKVYDAFFVAINDTLSTY